MPRLARIRNSLVHGTLEDMNLVGGVFRFRIAETKPEHREVARFDLDPLTFPALEREYSNVLGRAGALSLQLLDHFRPNRPRRGSSPSSKALAHGKVTATVTHSLTPGRLAEPAAD